MTFDSALLHRPTDSLILPTKRRFFPFKIPNFHQQLRHYISTADPDRIYVAVDRVIYAIHISSQKRESLALIPFEPKCLAAGHGWIGVGGSDNGECAFIRIADRSERVRHDTSGPRRADVDSALPIDLEPASRDSSPWASSEELGGARNPSRRQLPQPEVQLQKFGGSIVNSVTIHRLPGDGERLADEDAAILSNNDHTVTVYSLTRSKVLKVIHHRTCMNYAIISPDSKVLAAVGDENRAYFYGITRNPENTVAFTETRKKLTGWDWTLLRCIELEISPRFDDGCCFTIAFSPSSHLCAVGSQSGIITIFDVKTIRESTDEEDQNPTLCLFRSSRSYFDGGAVRCMTFSPEPWDLLVWIEDHGRAGVADVRQAFSRRQILTLDMNEPGLQEVRTESITSSAAAGESGSDSEGGNFPRSGDDMDAMQRAMLDIIEGSSNEPNAGSSDRQSLRESLIQDLTERERQIVEFLNTARWTSRLEEGLNERPLRMNVHARSRSRSRAQGSAEGTNRSSTSPFRYSDALHEVFREGYLGRMNPTDRSLQPRRQSSVVPSQGNQGTNNQISEMGASNSELRPTITLSWTASPSDMQSTSSENPSRAADPGTLTANAEAAEDRSHETISAARTFIDPSLPAAGSRQRSQRSSSIPRRSERPDAASESRMLNAEVRANVAAERLRRQRQMINETHVRDQRYRQHFLGFDRSPRWIRSILNDLPDRNLGHAHRDQEPGGTAGVGWGADGRTLYIGTVDGIFEYQINVQDRKTFPVFSYR
ncbi:hypothetical protein VTN00DRAFT_313 [Thermoascus crustaceus]|uniref:uncharacterized protein n=1 Tax=Thermoascus crustaceus TaxID=5088 RepID=UPI003743B057